MKITTPSSEKEGGSGKTFKYSRLACNKICKAFLGLENGTIFFRFASHEGKIYCQYLDTIDTTHYLALEQTTYDATSETKLAPQDIERLSTYIGLLFNSVEQRWLQVSEPKLDKRYIFSIVISEGKIIKIVRERFTKKSKRKVTTTVSKEVDTILGNLTGDKDTMHLY